MQVEDPWTSEFLKYKEMGFSHEEVGMALGALGSDADQDGQVRHLSPPSSEWAKAELGLEHAYVDCIRETGSI